MKTNFLKLASVMLIPLAYGCKSGNNTNANADSLATDSSSAMSSSSTPAYVNLSDGKTVTIIRDEEKGYYVYSDTKKPIENDLFFVDVSTSDTLYGQRGVVVNNAVVKSDAGSWMLNEAMVERNGEEVKVKAGDSKLKIDGNEVKYKEEDGTKVKIDGDETKTKSGDTKTKTDGAESKTKTGDTKVKVDD